MIKAPTQERSLALESEIIICDEAVSTLDVHVQAQVIALLARLRSELGLAYLFIAHDYCLSGILLTAWSLCEMVKSWNREQGTGNREQGTVQQIFDNPQQQYTRDLLDASLEPDPVIQAQ